MSTYQRMLVSNLLLLLLALSLVGALRRNNARNISGRKLSPVILVGGVGGNKLHAKLNKKSAPHFLCSKKTDYYDIWLDPTQLIPGRIDCWVDNMMLLYDKATRTVSNNHGVSIVTPPWGGTLELENVDSSIASQVDKHGIYYRYIVQSLLGRGYVRQRSIFGAPYDFRKGPSEHREWVGDLKTLTENAYAINDETKVTFIVHSLGGKMILHFLQQMPQSWKDQYVKRVISLSGVFGGSVKSLLGVSTGYDLDVKFISKDKMKIIQRTFPSVGWMLPMANFWEPNKVLATIGQNEYTVQNIDEFLYAFGVPNMVEIRKDQEKYNNLSAPGVEMHCVIGTGVATPEILHFKSVRSRSNPEIEYGNGDGTVNMRGLLACQKWNNTPAQGKHAVYQHEFPGVEHFEMLGNAEIINYILETLTGTGITRSRAGEIAEYEKIMEIRLI